MTSPPSIAPSEPFDGPSTIESVTLSPSGSVHSSGTWRAASTAVRTATSSHAGGREMEIDTVAGAEWAVPSLAR